MKEHTYFKIEASKDGQKWGNVSYPRSPHTMSELKTEGEAIEFLADKLDWSDLKLKYKYFRIVKCIERIEEIEEVVWEE